MPGTSCVVIKNSPSSYESRSVSLRNFMILYNHNKFKYATPNSEKDVDFEGPSSSLTIQNVYRSMQMPSVETSSLYGVNVANTLFMKNQAANSISSVLIGSNFYNDVAFMLNNYVSYQMNDYSKILYTGGLMTPIYVSNNSDNIILDSTVSPSEAIENGTYEYQAVVMFDTDRMLGSSSSSSWASTGLVNSAKYIRLMLSRSFTVGVCIRLFKRLNSTYWYIDIPVCSAFNFFYDFGKFTSFGEKWINIGTNYSTYIPTECTTYQSFGVNVKVTTSGNPTKGTWRKGDIINYSNTYRVVTVEPV